MLIKKIGTSQLVGNGESQDETFSAHGGETASLDRLRQSLGTGNTLNFGQVLQSRYEIEQVIGYGGMSTVYRGRDLRFTDIVRVVAVKEMFDVSTDPSSREDKIRRFKQEANTLAALNHPAIPKILDFFPHNDRMYLILEFIEGKNLETVLEERKQPVEEQKVINWGIQLSDVLSYLHNQKPHPLIFRDMKPSNVMLTNQGRLVLIDFGIAKNFQDDKKGTMIGTEGYSPPEQYKGMAIPAGDIYALGATLHQLLTNSDPRLEVPFTFHERLPHKLNPEVSLAAEGVIMKALEFDSSNRWKSVEEFKQALTKLVSEKNSGISRLSTSYTKTGIETRELNLPVINGTIAVTGIIKTNSSPKLNPTIQSSPNRPTQPSINFDASTGIGHDSKIANQLWSFACEEEVRSSPVINQNMLFIGCYDSNLYALDLKTGQFIWKAATNGGVAGTPCISDLMVIVGSEDGSVYAFDQARGEQKWVFRTGGPVRSSPRVHSPLLFFGSDDNHIYAVEARTGRQVWKARTWKPVRSSPAIADGKVYIGSDDGHLYALDGTNGNVLWKWRAQDEIRSSPVVQDNMVYVGSMDNHLNCIDAQTSWPVWRFKTDSYVISSPTINAGRVYFGSVDGNMYCLEAKNKKLVWKFNTGSQITSSPRVVDGVVYFGCNDSNVYAVDAGSGQLKWYYPTEGPLPSSPAVLNGTVYIGSNDYHVYALKAL